MSEIEKRQGHLQEQLQHRFKAHREEERLYRKISSEYAQVALRGLLLLNGGALVAIPAYMNALSEARSHEIGSLFVATVPFLISLVTAMLCCLCSYFNLWWKADIADLKEAEEFYVSVSLFQSARKSKADVWDKKVETAAKIRSDIEDRIQPSFYLSVTLSLLSLSMFCVGVLLIGQTVSVLLNG